MKEPNAVKLGERIKSLRLRDKRTQEELATALGITAQAVSRWEKSICYPDMELIPSIASYFGISIDELFGYDNEMPRKIDALAERINEMNRRNNGEDVCMDECITLAREAIIEFPGNAKLTLALASALYNAGYVRHGEFYITGSDGYRHYDVDRHLNYPEWREAIKLYENLLPSLTDGKMRQQAMIELSDLYANCGEYDKALVLAEMAPNIYASKTILRIKAFDGKEIVSAYGESLLEMVKCSSELIVSIVLRNSNILPTVAAKMLMNAVSMIELICTDGFYGELNNFIACLYMLCSYYQWLGDEHDAAFASLDQALENAKAYDNLPDHHISFTAPLLRDVTVKHNSHSISFTSELPEIWPGWSVTQYDLVKTEMQADERWELWVKKTKTVLDYSK